MTYLLKVNTTKCKSSCRDARDEWETSWKSRSHLTVGCQSRDRRNSLTPSWEQKLLIPRRYTLLVHTYSVVCKKKSELQHMKRPDIINSRIFFLLSLPILFHDREIFCSFLSVRLLRPTYTSFSVVRLGCISLSLSLSLSLSHTHTHVNTHIYIHIYIYNRLA